MRTIALPLVLLVCTDYVYGLDIEGDDSLSRNLEITKSLASMLVGLNTAALSPSRHVKAKGAKITVKSPIDYAGKGVRLSVPISIQGTNIKLPVTFIVKSLKGLQLTIPLTFALSNLVKFICKPSVDKCEVTLKEPLKFNAGGVPLSTSVKFGGKGLKEVDFPLSFSLFGHNIVIPLSISDLTSIKKVFDGRKLADFEVKDFYGVSADLAQYKGQVVLVVDAKGLSKSDYSELHRLQKKFKGRGLQVLILGSTSTLQEMLLYARDLLFSGPRHLDRKSAEPILEWLNEHVGGTNKFIVGRNGKPVASGGKSLEKQVERSLKRFGVF